MTLVTAFHIAQSLSGLPFILLLALRIFMSAVFLVSGTGKIWDLKGTRQALSDFGIPDSWTDGGAKLLPAGELLIGLGLLFDLTFRSCAFGAAILSLAFTLAIANLLRQGRRPPCHCFGAVHSAEVGPTTLIRAGLLFILSLAAYFLATPELTTSIKAACQAGVGALLLISLTSNVVFWKQLHGKSGRGKRLQAGQRLPSLRLSDGTWLSEKLSTRQRNLIILTSSTCSACKSISESFQEWRTTLSNELNLLELRSVTEGTETAPGTLLTKTEELGKLAVGTPGALLLDGHGVILSPSVLGREEIEALLKVATGQTPSRPRITWHAS